MTTATNFDVSNNLQPNTDDVVVPGARTVLIADENLVFREVQVSNHSPTGEQIVVASTEHVFSDTVLLQLLPSGELESIRFAECPSLEVSNKFLIARSDRTYFFTLDGARIEWPYRQISGHIIRVLGRVGDERDVVLTLRPGQHQVLENQNIVDLDSPGIEVMTTKLRSWKLRVQAVTMEYSEPLVKVSDAMKRSGFDPTKAWHIFLIVEGQSKVEVTTETIIDLRTPGIEKLRLMQRNVDNGEGLSRELANDFDMLEVDIAYLNNLGLPWETVASAGRQWLLIHDYPLRKGYTPATVLLALDIPKDYPAAQIDMFYFSPFVDRMDGQPIASTQVRAVINNVEFQGWSRHRNGVSPWNPNVDNVATHLALVDSCLDREFGE